MIIKEIISEMEIRPKKQTRIQPRNTSRWESKRVLKKHRKKSKIYLIRVFDEEGLKTHAHTIFNEILVKNPQCESYRSVLTHTESTMDTKYNKLKKKKNPGVPGCLGRLGICLWLRSSSPHIRLPTQQNLFLPLPLLLPTIVLSLSLALK